MEYTAPIIRWAICRYGSPHDGRSGLTRIGQYRGLRSAPPRPPTLLPSKRLSASMMSASIPTGRPNASANGAAVSWARCSGEATIDTMSCPCPSVRATVSA